MKVLGFERENKYRYVMDVLLSDKEEELKLIIPEMPEENTSSSELDFVDIESYKKEECLGEKVGIKLYKMNSDGRRYIAVKPTKVRDNVVFRVVDGKDADYVARVVMELVVIERRRSDAIPKVFITEEDGMFVESERFDERYTRLVRFAGVTPLTEGSCLDAEGLNDKLDKKLKESIIKEVGDCEISLSVIEESVNL